MKSLPLKAFFKISLDGRSSKMFFVGVVASFAFSIAVILSTIGLMDGFEQNLLSSLKVGSGDFKISHKNGFFKYDTETFRRVKGIDKITPVVQVEGFVVINKQSSGALIKGIDIESFGAVTGLKLDQIKSGVAIGKELANKFSINIGDEIVIIFANSNSKNQGAPIVSSYRVEQIVGHGIYEQDLRFIYISRENLLNTISYKKSVANWILASSSINSVSKADIKKTLPSEYNLAYYWEDFQTLIDAIEVEKNTITLILQLIVFVSIFNLIAFVIYVYERKKQEFFLLQALGLKGSDIEKFWYVFYSLVWFFSCMTSMFFIELFDLALAHVPWLKIPGDIYVLSILSISLNLTDFLLVFAISYIWIMIVGYFTSKKFSKRTILEGLREEFS